MIKKHSFNGAESLRVYEENKDIVKYKECYNNIYNLATRHYFPKLGWKIAYGYIRVAPDSGMWARHCFIVDKKGEAIDPTFYTHINHFPGEVKEHTSFYVFRDVLSYGLAVKKNKLYPALLEPLRKNEYAMHQWAEKENMVLLGG